MGFVNSTLWIGATKAEILAFFGTIMHCSLLGKLLLWHFCVAISIFFPQNDAEVGCSKINLFMFVSPYFKGLTEPDNGSDASGIKTIATKV